MHRLMFLVFLALTAVHCYGQQVQMPVAAELQEPDSDLQAQVKDLQRNVSEIWSYIYELRNAVSGHLTHLRQHQVELETSMHKMEHLHESELQSSGHHHSGEQHSHSSEHGGDHHHSDEHHSHSGEHHSHSGEHHSHSYSHSHSMDDHSHSHGGDHQHHKDLHETEDLSQQTQQAVGPIVEPIVTATDRQEHYHHNRQTSRSGHGDSLNLMNENSFHRHHHHSHHDDSSNRGRNRTVELPKYSDYGLYDLALCDVTPNRAIPEDKQQNVGGTITLWQKKSGGPLNLHIRLQGFNVGDHHGHHQSVQQEDTNEASQTVGHRHGFHIHTNGDLSNGCESTGPHFNPKGVTHGGSSALVRHVGDLGNIECDEHGVTNILMSDDIASLKGPYSIIGKSLVVHAMQDDLGLGGDEESTKTGNAGTRIACCVIRKVDKIPIRQHKAMKSAVQYQSR